MLFLSLTCQGCDFGRSLSTSEAAGFAVIVSALEVKHGSPSEQAALAPPSTGMNCTVLAGDWVLL